MAFKVGNPAAWTNWKLALQVKGILADLSVAQPVIDCAWDPTLHTTFGAADQKYLLAADIHNNEELLPHYIIQLVHLLTVMPHGSTFLSVYESGSTDSTGACMRVTWCMRAVVQTAQGIYELEVGG